jgi:hypothetical protein
VLILFGLTLQVMLGNNKAVWSGLNESRAPGSFSQDLTFRNITSGE